ncbi:uncharacterized protein CTRU02_215117 [Colletotrichum truncatum]|uniref:Uncharacterized protein n=1 Tax=Colletotrichum truncatum TaxID=5467 RepID=A0ACC3YDK9_COLTU|nr:uncharacterized protein CTRU02_13697 [Colletotrichum truncatum]KAF6783045.1 hypothetical protein CTRU02_13697 [Colletotrichum truncatum]
MQHWREISSPIDENGCTPSGLAPATAAKAATATNLKFILTVLWWVGRQ